MFSLPPLSAHSETSFWYGASRSADMLVFSSRHESEENFFAAVQPVLSSSALRTSSEPQSNSSLPKGSPSKERKIILVPVEKLVELLDFWQCPRYFNP